MAGGDVGVDGDRALAVAAGDGLQRRLLVVGDQGRQRHQLPGARAHLQPRQVLGPRALGGQQLDAHVEAPAAGAVLAGEHAADQGVERGGHVVDRDADVGDAGAVGRDAQLGHAQPVVGVQVDHDAAGGQLGHHLLAQGDELVPVGAAHRELHREAPLGGEARLRQVLDDGAHAGDGVQFLAQHGGELRLGEAALLGRHQADEDVALADAAAPAADRAEHAHDLGLGADDGLDLFEELVGLLQGGADGGLQADVDQALVLGGDELAGHDHEYPQRGQEEDQGAQQDQSRALQALLQHPRIEVFQPAEALVHEQAHAAAAGARGHQELRAAGRGQGDRLDVGEEDGQAQGDAELQEEAADDAGDENDRDEDGHHGQRGGQGGEGDLVGPFQGGAHQVLAALGVAVDVLHDHDGVVDHDAHGQGHGQQGEGVEGEAQEVDDGHRAQQRHGDGQDDVERGGEGAEEHPADQGGEQDREEQLELDLVAPTPR